MKKQIQYICFILFGLIHIIGQAQEKKKLPQHEKEAIQFIYKGNQEITKEKANVIEAEKSYRKAIAKDPDNPIAKYNLGVSYHATQNFQEAAQRNEQAAKLAKTEGEKHAAFHNLGNSYMGTGEPDKAIEAYKNALRNNPTDHQTRYNLALAKKAKEQQDKNKPKDGDKNKEEKKNDDKKEDSGKDEKDKDGDKEKKENDKKDGEEDKENDKNKENENEKPSDKEGDEEKKKQPPRPAQGQLSPEQVKSLLQAMENQEKKVQEKVNARKVKGVPVKSDKDW